MSNKLLNKFNMTGMTNTIVIAPAMLDYLLKILPDLEEDSGMPLTTYNILPNLYCSQENCYIFDDEGKPTLVKFTFNASNFLLGEGEDNE